MCSILTREKNLMRSCFVNLPWEEEDRTGIRAGCRFPNLTLKNTNTYVPYPFLLGYAAAFSEQRGIDTLCIDGVAERSTNESVRERIDRFAPDLIVAETSTTSLAHDLRALAELHERSPQARIAIYGSHVDTRPLDALNSPGIDFVIKGEPEVTSYELVCAIANGEDPRSVAGLAFKSDGGHVAYSQPRPLIADLDSLPYPKRDAMPLNRYSVAGFPQQVVFMYGSRGCPYKCTFCLWPQTNLKGKYRTRSGEKIVEEMVWVLDQFPETRSFFFDDDTFNLGRSRVLAFAAEMKRRKLHIPWGMNARADNWDRETMEQLADTGLFTLRMGIESGDEKVLARTQKGLALDDARRTMELAHSLGIQNHAMFIIGLPGETTESVENTIRFIKSVPVDSVQFSVAIPFPGTAFYAYAEENGFLVTNDWSKYNGFDHVVVRTETMTPEEIDAALIRARRKVYFSPHFIVRRLAYVRSLQDLGALARKVTRLLGPRFVRTMN